MGGRGTNGSRNTENIELNFTLDRKNKNYPQTESASLYKVALPYGADFRYRVVGNDSFYVDRVYIKNSQGYLRVNSDSTTTLYRTLWGAISDSPYEKIEHRKKDMIRR